MTARQPDKAPCVCHRQADGFPRPTVVASEDTGRLYLLASGQAIAAADVSIEADGSLKVIIRPGLFDRIEWADLVARRANGGHPPRPRTFGPCPVDGVPCAIPACVEAGGCQLRSGAPE